MDRLELAALSAALQEQTEGDVKGVITGERIYEALTTGPDFTKEERRLIWLSPDVRATYFNVRSAIDREVRFRMREAGYGEELHLRAASGESDVETIKGTGYVLTLFRDRGEDADEWSLSLQLDQQLRRLIPSKKVIRLRDRGGLIWVEGVVDSAGQISALWDNQDQSPIERAAQHGLILDT